MAKDKKTRKNGTGVGHHVGLTEAKVKKEYKKQGENASATARALKVSTATVRYWLGMTK